MGGSASRLGREAVLPIIGGCRLELLLELSAEVRRAPIPQVPRNRLDAKASCTEKMRGSHQPPSGRVVPDTDTELALKKPAGVGAGNTEAQRLAHSIEVPSDLPVISVYEPAELSSSTVRFSGGRGWLWLKGPQHASRITVEDDFGRLIEHTAPLRDAGRG